MNLILFEEDEMERPLPYTDPRSKHIRKILRLGPGDSVQVGVVEGRRGTAVITEMGPEGVRLRFDLEVPLFRIQGIIRGPSSFAGS